MDDKQMMTNVKAPTITDGEFFLKFIRFAADLLEHNIDFNNQIHRAAEREAKAEKAAEVAAGEILRLHSRIETLEAALAVKVRIGDDSYRNRLDCLLTAAQTFLDAVLEMEYTTSVFDQTGRSAFFNLNTVCYDIRGSLGVKPSPAGEGGGSYIGLRMGGGGSASSGPSQLTEGRGGLGEAAAIINAGTVPARTGDEPARADER